MGGKKNQNFSYFSCIFSLLQSQSLRIAISVLKRNSALFQNAAFLSASIYQISHLVTFLVCCKTLLPSYPSYFQNSWNPNNCIFLFHYVIFNPTTIKLTFSNCSIICSSITKIQPFSELHMQLISQLNCWNCRATLLNSVVLLQTCSSS